ncbi:MAG: ring-opening amidohydrolase [Candidatus Protistobacter heckmanni]|nr:ring-opening amidohydrolase [Candidatus Protistobacter heckmanni]
MKANVHRLSMQHPGDVSALEALIVSGEIRPEEIVAVIGKTEGNGGVNDFTRGYFTQSLMGMLARHLNTPAEALLHTLPCVLSGGTEGVLSPHYLVFSRGGEHPAASAAHAGPGALAIGVAFSQPVAAEEVGRAAQIRSVAEAVVSAIADAGIRSLEDVRFVQVKCPCVTIARAQDAQRRGKAAITSDPNRSMAYARAAGAFGVGIALNELGGSADEYETALLADFSLHSPRASISSGVEIDRHEVIVLGNSPAWTGPLRIAHQPMADALDIGSVYKVLAELGILADHQVREDAAARIAGVLVKCEPDRRGRIHGQRHTMLDDTDINAQRHVRGAVGGMVASVLGDGRIFVSGGAEHQGPDGGGLLAVIAAAADTSS